MLATHPLLVPRLRKGGAIHPFPPSSSMERNGTTLLCFLYISQGESHTPVGKYVIGSAIKCNRVRCVNYL
jgi:hypothetical protein